MKNCFKNYGSFWCKKMCLLMFFDLFLMFFWGFLGGFFHAINSDRGMIDAFKTQNLYFWKIKMGKLRERNKERWIEVLGARLTKGIALYSSLD